MAASVIRTIIQLARAPYTSWIKLVHSMFISQQSGKPTTKTTIYQVKLNMTHQWYRTKSKNNNSTKININPSKSDDQKFNKPIKAENAIQIIYTCRILN